MSTTETTVRERPILFSAPMVLALLNGSKTQTRRIVKFDEASKKKPLEFIERNWNGYNFNTPEKTWGVTVPCPYGKKGDRLWVKETWRPVDSLATRDKDWRDSDTEVAYAADGRVQTFFNFCISSHWRMPKAAATGNVTPLFMPRWASRILLEIVSVRVERLQEISEQDAVAEGIEQQKPLSAPDVAMWRDYELDEDGIGQKRFRGAPFNSQDSYRTLWDHINGPSSWAANPWVWVVEFKRL